MRAPRLVSSLALALAVALGGSLSSARPARAEPPPTVVTTRAKAHFKQGRAYQEAGSFDAAIGEYLAAYRLAPRPELLFNIAQCHRLAGHAAKAVEFYRRYLDDAPEGAAADESRTHVATLQKQLDAERARPQPAPRPAPAPSAPPPGAGLDVRGDRERDERTPRPAGALTWIGVASVVTGAALVGTGAYLGWRAADEADALAASSEWNAELDAREEAAQLDERRMWYLVGGGSALLIGGGALWWWSGRPRSVEAAPDLSSDRAGVIVRGRF